MVSSSSNSQRFVRSLLLAGALALGQRETYAQGRDSLLNGAAIGAALGAGAGVAFTHAVRDSDLVFSQYARSALIFGAMGAGVGLGVDALLNRTSTGPQQTPRRVLVTPAVWSDLGGVVVSWRW